jgi:hypothetical protein
MLGRGQVKAKGVFAPEGCIEPEIFLKEIKENGVVIQETYQTSAEL